MIIDNKKIFEKIRPYQLTALKCLASYGIINKDYLESNKVSVVSKDLMEKYSQKIERLSDVESNVLNLLTSHFYYVSMFGNYGLKARTQLLESKYDVQ